MGYNVLYDAFKAMPSTRAKELYAKKRTWEVAEPFPRPQSLSLPQIRPNNPSNARLPWKALPPCQSQESLPPAQLLTAPHPSRGSHPPWFSFPITLLCTVCCAVRLCGSPWLQAARIPFHLSCNNLQWASGCSIWCLGGSTKTGSRGKQNKAGV